MSFTAKYRGDCASEFCNRHGRIAEGDLVEYVEGELMHTQCAKAENGEPKGVLCNACHMYHRGSCL